MIKIFKLTWLLLRHKQIIANQKLAKTLTALGPIYIKLGQALSTRPDLIGESAAEDLKNLQDKLPPFPTSVAIKIFESECKLKIDDLFSNFNETPVAAASIAQVHKAQLKSGKYVAVKILRPDIEKKYAADIKFLRFIARLMHRLLPKYKRLKAPEVVRLFDRTMKTELNLKMEAANASELKDHSREGVCIPEIYWQFTTRRVMVSQWVEGLSIYDSDGIIAQGLNPRDLAAKVVMMFWDQAYNHGFFHADLHPGNILVGKEGSIILLDFGIMSRLPELDRFCIAEILGAFLVKDYLRVAKVHQRAGYIAKNTDLFAFAQQCRIIAEPIMGLNLSDISIANLLEELFKVTEEFGMEVQPQILMLQKTMVMVEGIGKSLDPDINIWKLAEPWMKKWAIKNISTEAKFVRMIKEFSTKLFID